MNDWDIKKMELSSTFLHHGTQTLLLGKCINGSAALRGNSLIAGKSAA
jgi:hypothetical protein